MPYSVEANTSDCYDGTSCLKNKFNITDSALLGEIEGNITFLKISYLESNPICGTFDFEHYKRIHRFIFEDIYEWAGCIRTVDISKKGTRFVSACEIDDLAEKCFSRLKEQHYFMNDSFEEFVENITDFYCTTNTLHPFREGNGRTQRVFISQLIRNAGYDINFSQIDSDELMIATIQAANGIVDPLKILFGEYITES